MSGPLVEAAWLTRALSRPQRPVLLDVRWRLGGPGIDSCRAGPLSGAAFTDLDRDQPGQPGWNDRHHRRSQLAPARPR